MIADKEVEAIKAFKAAMDAILVNKCVAAAILDAGKRGAILDKPATVARRASIDDAIPRIYPQIMERIDSEVAAKLGRGELLTGHPAGGAGIIAVELLEVEGAAASFLARHAIDAEEMHFARHVAKTLGVEPQPHEVPPPPVPSVVINTCTSASVRSRM